MAPSDSALELLLQHLEALRLPTGFTIFMDEQAEQLSVPLVVDLDTALVRGNLFLESLCARLRRGPFSFIRSIFQEVAKGTFSNATFRQAVFSGASQDVRVLPYAPHLLTFLRDSKAQGRELLLLTEASGNTSIAIAQHLEIFNRTIHWQSAEGNVPGQKKLHAIREALGTAEFDYAGAAADDEVVWREARQRIIVNNTRAEIERLARLMPCNAVFDPVSLNPLVLARAVRIHQFSKNALLLVPLIAAHEMGNFSKWGNAILAFVAFSLTAASVYLLNDGIDLEADRRHPLKRNRPLASGELPLRMGLVLMPALAVLGLLCALCLGRPFFLIMLLYLALTTSYTFFIKRLVIADSILLACLYTLRILAGGVATGIVVSHWLLGFAIFFFLSLAYAKRYTEIYRLRKRGNQQIRGRGYMTEDLELVAQFGAASGYISVLIFALYVNSGVGTHTYRNTDWLWLICPLLLYWISRIWILAGRGKLHEDAVVFAMTDKVSYFIGAIAALIMYLAS